MRTVTSALPERHDGVSRRPIPRGCNAHAQGRRVHLFLPQYHHGAIADKLPDVGGAAGYLNKHPMADMTGLKGSYDFDIVWLPPACVYGRGGRGDSGGVRDCAWLANRIPRTYQHAPVCPLL